MADKITFDKLKLGQTAQVDKINTQDKILKRRIMDMGITKGVLIKVIKIAPLGDPVAISLRGYTLSIRKSDLAMIEGEIVKTNNNDNGTKQTKQNNDELEM